MDSWLSSLRGIWSDQVRSEVQPESSMLGPFHLFLEPEDVVLLKHCSGRNYPVIFKERKITELFFFFSNEWKEGMKDYLQSIKTHSQVVALKKTWSWKGRWLHRVGAHAFRAPNLIQFDLGAPKSTWCTPSTPNIMVWSASYWTRVMKLPRGALERFTSIKKRK